MRYQVDNSQIIFHLAHRALKRRRHRLRQGLRPRGRGGAHQRRQRLGQGERDPSDRVGAAPPRGSERRRGERLSPFPRRRSGGQDSGSDDAGLKLSLADDLILCWDGCFCPWGASIVISR